MLTDKQRTDKADFIQAMREQLDWLESKPDLRRPLSTLQFDWFADTKEEYLELRRAAGVNAKLDRGPYLSFSLPFRRNNIAFINIEKEKTCKRVKVGTKTVAATPEREEDVYEWQCDEPLLAVTAITAET